jgi:hypothetical protein
VSLASIGLAASTSNPGFDLLLIAHVTCAIVGFGALVTSGVQAARLQRSEGGRVPPALRRYFAPGVNWAGRVLYGVPVFGFLLLADSGGRLRAADPWVVAGLALWGTAAVVAEGVLWPAERRIQAVLAGPSEGSGRALAGDCRLVAGLGGTLGLVFVVATVLMVARPG